MLVYVRQYQNEVVLCVANLSRSAQAAEIDLAPWRGRIPFELLGRTNFPPIGDDPYLITLAPYGFFWFLLLEPDASTIEVPTTPAEFETLVVTDGWKSLSQGRSRSVLERDVLPAFLAGRRWFAERGNLATTTHIAGTIPLIPADPELGLAIVEANGRHATANYLLPLTIKWTRFDRERQNPNALAAVRRGPREGTLLDATADARLHFLRARKPARLRSQSRPTSAASSSSRRPGS